MQRQVTWVWGLAAVLLVGCSTPIGPLAPPPLPDNPATAANVVVYRDAAPVDDALLMLFTINGAGTYELRPKERYNFVLGAGTYEFGYQMGMSNCSDAVRIDARGNYVFKLGSGCAIVLESQ